MRILKYLGIASILIATSFAQSTQQTDPLGSIDTVDILFVNLEDAADCLKIDLNDCAALQTKASQYDVAKWIGAIYCRPTTNTCANCYTQVDGVNIKAVIPVIQEVIREPVLCHVDESVQVNGHPINHSLAGQRMFNIVSLNVAESTNASRATMIQSDVLGTTQLNKQVTWDNIRAVFEIKTAEQNLGDIVYTFDGGQGQQIPLVAPSLDLDALSLPDHWVGAPVIRYNKPTVLATAGVIEGTSAQALVTGTATDAGGPSLAPSEQTPNTANQLKQYAMAESYYTSVQWSATDKVKLCGVQYEVKGYGSVDYRVLEDMARAKKQATAQGDFTFRDGTTVGSFNHNDVKSQFNHVTGFWNCQPFRAFEENVYNPSLTKLPSDLN